MKCLILALFFFLTLAFQMVCWADDEHQRPPKEKLPAAEIAMPEKSVKHGASDSQMLEIAQSNPLDWWSLKRLERPIVPEGTHPIDAFIRAELASQGLQPSPLADRRTLMRRLTLDLHGMLPTPEEIKVFENDSDPRAWENLVDELLASPRYGERWARHWMDAVRYAETHGHDEDAIRENAWPYRDWIISAFNNDKPYADFVREQVAGDVIAADDPWATAATGFLASGPWDSSSQMGIQDGTIDKKIAQYLDRDDMLSATMSTFTSTTVHCARCHDHKFDPVSLKDYYALQAVFAGIDKVDRPFDLDPAVALKRRELLAGQTGIESQIDDPAMQEEVSAWVKNFESSAKNWMTLTPKKVTSASGTPHQIQPDGSILFGGAAPEKDTYTVTGTTKRKRLTAVQLEVLTDDSFPVKGPGRAPNGNLHLSEIRVNIGGVPVPFARASADFNQADWEVHKAIDGNPASAWGIHPHEGRPHRAIFVFKQAVAVTPDTNIEIILEQLHGGSHLIGRPRISLTGDDQPDQGFAMPAAIEAILSTPEPKRSAEQRRQLAHNYLKEKYARELAALPDVGKIFAVASQFKAIGNFKPAGHPREVHVLHRGDIQLPKEVATPGALACLPGLPDRFELADPKDEGARRAALADWLAHRDNVLTWRSIVNRVWHYHFGRGIVATPNDFGKMGAAPTHPELLDWLAFEFRERGGSLKWLHKTILLSDTYRQSAADRQEGIKADVDNRLLWRMNRQRLDAESIRDAVLSLSGRLDLKMGGPSARQFHSSKGVHVTPNLDYLGFDPDDPANLRRSVYRFVFRTVPDPLMQALDCPDASQLAPRRETSATALQALAMLNNRFLVRQSEHIATDLKASHPDLAAQINELFLRAYGRSASPDESAQIAAYATKHGLANACRIILNSSEFLFVH